LKRAIHHEPMHISDLPNALCPGPIRHGAQPAPPDDFPRFQVPGHEKEMATLRDLFWLHYPGAGPKATLWDEWLPDASLWPAVSTDKQI